MLRRRWFSFRKNSRRLAAGMIAGAMCFTSAPGGALTLQAGAMPAWEAGIGARAAGEEENAVYLSDSRQWLWAYAGLDSKKTEMYGDAQKVPEGSKMPQLNRRYENSASWSRTTDINLCDDALEGITNWDQIVASGHVQKADKGIGTSACSEIVYELQPEDKRFCATIGFDASVLTNGQRPSSVEMKVLGSKTEDRAGEYEELYSSGIRYTLANDAERPYFVPQDVDVSVEGYKYLKLWVWDAGQSTNNAPNNNPSDAVNWAWARILTRELTPAERLEKAIADAEKLDASVYLADSWAKVQAALEEAKAVSEDAPEETVTAAVAKLDAAVAGLVKRADKSALEKLVEKVEGRDFTGFDAGLVAAFQAALSKARGVLADETLSENDAAKVKAAEDELQAAYDALMDTIKEPVGEEFDWISDLKAASVKVGYGSLGIDKTVNNSGALTLDGVTYDKGLGAHAPAELVYNLDGKYQFFHAVVGIDDTRVANTNLGVVQFQVFLNEDTDPVFESSRMGTGAKPETIGLPLSDTDSKLRIVILTPDNKNTNDWTDVADAKLYLNEKGVNYAEQNINRFEVEEQANRTVIDAENKIITIKVPHGTDLGQLHISALETNARTEATIQGAEATVGTVIDAKGKDVVIRVANRAGEATDWTVKVIEKEQKAILDSDNQILKDNFYWATHKVDQFVMTGQEGMINKAADREGTGPVDYIPSYWAGYYDRTAFYGRDFCHQATGGQLGGLRDENYSMFKIFAQGATEARKYYTLWAFNFDGSPYTIDYRSDTNFVREVPAQFELVQRAYEQYQWKGDDRYIYDEDLFKCYTNVMTKYIELHDDQKPNGVAEGYGGIWAGSCTYNERGEHPIEAGDAIGAQYQATLAYAGILEARGEAVEAAAWYQKAQDLKDYFNEEWSANPDDPTGNYARVITAEGGKLYDFGKENSWFMPMKLITEPGERNDKYLDFISQQLGNGIGDKNAPNAPKNIEAYTYIPDTYFPYDRNQEAWKWMRYIAGVKDNPHERPVQGTNGDYPEISFTFVAQTIEGIMGIEANAGKHAVATASHLVTEGTEEEKMGYVDVTDIRMGTHMLDVRHDGRTKTTLQNHSEDSLTWEARFYGNYGAISCGGEKLPARQKEINGELVSYVTIEVAPEEEVVASVAEDVSAEEEVTLLRQEVERLDGELAKAEAEAAQKEKELAKAKEELENAKGDLEVAQAEATAAQLEAEAAAKREAAAVKRAEAAEAQAALLQAEADSLRAQAGELASSNQQLALEKEAAEKEAAAAKKEAEAQKSRAEAAEERAKEEAAKAEAAEKRAQAEKLKAEEEAAKAEAEKKRAEEEAKKAEAEKKRAEEEAKKAAQAEAEKKAALQEAEKQKAKAALKKGDAVFSKKILYTVLDPKKKTVVAQGSVSKNQKSLAIPDTVMVKGVKCKVTQIATGAFSENKKLTSVTIGKYVQKIGKQAFYKSAKLKKVTVKSTALKSVGSKAFLGIAKKAEIKVPKAKKSTYKKLLKGKAAKTVKIK